MTRICGQLLLNERGMSLSLFLFCWLKLNVIARAWAAIMDHKMEVIWKEDATRCKAAGNGGPGRLQFRNKHLSCFRCCYCELSVSRSWLCSYLMEGEINRPSWQRTKILINLWTVLLIFYIDLDLFSEILKYSNYANTFYKIKISPQCRSIIESLV